MKDFETDFFGTGTVGERGQIVIPSEARNALRIKAGDKFIFFGHGKIIHLIRADEMDDVLGKIHAKFENQMTTIRKKIDQKMNKNKTEAK